MVQLAALGIQNPQIDTMGAFRQGAATAAGIDEAKREAAEKSLQLVGAASMHALGGNIDGQADPAKFEEGLNMLQDMGINVEKFRGKPQLASVAARASMSALQQIQLAKDDAQFEMAMQKFGRDVMESDRSYELAQQDNALQREKFDYLKGQQGDPQSPLGKLKKDYDAGLIDDATYKAAVSKATSGDGGITVGPDGTITIGESLGKLTEGQSKDVNFYTRGIRVLPIVEKLEGALTGKTLTGVKDNLVSALPGGNYMTSEDFQQAQQAGREFLAVILRKDTGAAVTDAEFDLYGPMYLPWPGDGDKVLEQKRAARKGVIDSIKLGLGAKGDALGEAVDEPTGGAPPAAAAPAPEAPTDAGAPVYARNPQTGERMILRDGQWVPVQ